MGRWCELTEPTGETRELAPFSFFKKFFAEMRFFALLNRIEGEKLFKGVVKLEKTEFTAAVEQYSDLVYRVALNVCKNPADAEDITQTVFLKLLKEETPFENREHCRRWLIRVAVNEGKSLLRSAWFKRSAPFEDYAGTVEFETPEESEIFLAVMALPPKYRVPVYLFYYEDYPVKDVAALCGLKESTVQTRLQRAREKLRQLLKENHEKGERKYGT